MIEAFLTGVLVGVVGSAAIPKVVTGDATPTERETQRYAEGEISLEELERRLEVLEDPEADRIRESVERVSGIGEATSWTIAERYRSLEELRRADVEDLEEISNVGEQRAKALKERL